MATQTAKGTDRLELLQQRREEMRLLMGAAAIFAFIGGLSVMTALIFFERASGLEAVGFFAPFGSVGLALLVAGAFLTREDVRALRDIKSEGKAS